MRNADSRSNCHRGGGTPANATGTGAKASGGSKEATVGDTLDLDGASGLKMAVTVQRVVDPEQGGQFDQPDSGDRYVGVFIQLRNIGKVSYNDSPGNGATLLSKGGGQANSEILSGGSCSGSFSSGAIIAPGNTENGCLAFELPSDQSPGAFQFTLDSGFANQTGQWAITSTASGAPSGTGTTGTTTASETGATGTDTAGAGDLYAAAARGNWSDPGNEVRSKHHGGPRYKLPLRRERLSRSGSRVWSGPRVSHASESHQSGHGQALLPDVLERRRARGLHNRQRVWERKRHVLASVGSAV